MSESSAETTEPPVAESAPVKTKENPIKRLLSVFRRSSPAQEKAAAPEPVAEEPIVVKTETKQPPQNAPKDWEHKRIVMSEALDEVAAQYAEQLKIDKIIREKQAAAQKAKMERLQGSPAVPVLRKKAA